MPRKTIPPEVTNVAQPAPIVVTPTPTPPPADPAMPLPLSSFKVQGGAVDEITWTPESQVISALRWDGSEQAKLEARVRLRRAARQGTVVARRNPEHGYWEYGPQWRSKEFGLHVDAGHTAQLLGSSPQPVDGEETRLDLLPEKVQ